MPEGLRVLLADPSDVARSALRLMVQERWGWQVVGEASDHLQAVRRARELRPDVVLLAAAASAPDLDEVIAMLESLSVVPVLLLDSPVQHCYSAGPAVLRGMPAARMRRVIVDRARRFQPTGEEGRRP